MNTYAIWFDLADSSLDLAFAADLGRYLGALQELGTIQSYTLERRKFGFGPDGLGEFHARIRTASLAQLDAAFLVAATRAEPIESLHAAVFRQVRNFRAGLYRDFPDEVREV